MTVLTLFFYNIVDGTHPHASLQAYQFAGQLSAGWSLLIMESLRQSHRGRMISFIVLWGLAMQLGTFATVAPIYLAIHLSTSPTVWSRKRSDFLVNSSKLHSIPFSVAIAFVLPATLLALPAPSVIDYETKQLFMAIWQVFPITGGILQLVVPTVRSWLIDKVVVEETNKHSIDHMRTVYAIMLVVASVTRISTWTISLSAVYFPGIFVSGASSLLKPSSVFLPAAFTSSVKMPSIASSANQLLQYDDIIGAVAMVLWSATLYIIAMERKGPTGWASLVVKGVVIEALAGPLGFAAAAVWARDEIISASDDKEKKTL
ncbi:MAG: hypothetical protein L6R42_003822 [Xanthoria sp. 1 TBL-2021]|nr:MAG: hypothetical protein L6R42_003822 [Xanthoria sp. 1 TBL-2021]